MYCLVMMDAIFGRSYFASIPALLDTADNVMLPLYPLQYQVEIGELDCIAVELNAKMNLNEYSYLSAPFWMISSRLKPLPPILFT